MNTRREVMFKTGLLIMERLRHIFMENFKMIVNVQSKCITNSTFYPSDTHL